MYRVELYAQVRRSVYVEGLSEREATRRFGLARDTVRKMLRYAASPGYRRSKPVRRPKLDPFTGIIDQILSDDPKQPRKQRHTAKRIFDRLRDEYEFTGGYTIVKDYVRERKRGGQEMFVPLAHPPGDAQADFGEAVVVIGGEQHKAHFLVVDLPHSDDAFVKAFPAETTESFCEGHNAAFQYFGGVPRTIVYDNTTIAVARILGGGRTQAHASVQRVAVALLVRRSFRPPRQGQRQREGRGTSGLRTAQLHGADSEIRELGSLQRTPRREVSQEPRAARSAHSTSWVRMGPARRFGPLRLGRHEPLPPGRGTVEGKTGPASYDEGILRAESTIFLSVRWLLCGFLSSACLLGDQAQFFESRIRPVLAQKCWSCHGSELQQGGLRLDSREAFLKGGGRGPAVVPGDPSASLLLRALRHEGLEMPLGGKLPDGQVADFAKWIADGAAWPKLSDSSEQAGHWAFEPVVSHRPPGAGSAWTLNDVDRFIAAKLSDASLEPAPQADRRTLIRRLSFDLTGLPPRPEEVHAFVNDESPTAYGDLVDRLLSSKSFGEHWARKWMDWVRYSESHGSQGDFELPNAWRYRDYLIRAFNSDTPYDRMLLEYLAGDLLEDPRVNEEDGLNESMLGPGNLRMVEYGYLPVDALDDQVKVVDNQIDVLSKAFQGLTISCARCHDHKFDPITQKDFYALYGVFASSRHGLVTVDSVELLGRGRERLEQLRQKIKRGLTDAWTKAPVAMPQSAPASLPPDDPLQLWLALRGKHGLAFRSEWECLRSQWLDEAKSRRDHNSSGFRRIWDLAKPEDYSRWYPSGPGVSRTPSPNGEFRILPEGDRIVAGLLPAGSYSGLGSEKLGGIVGSPRFRVSSDRISVRVVVGNFISARLVVENYPIGNGGIHPAIDVTGGRPRWITFDTAYRRGANAHLELQTLDERSRPFRFNSGRPERKPAEDGRSSFGLIEVVFHDGQAGPRDEPAALLYLLDQERPEGVAELEGLYRRLVREAVAAWGRGELDERQTAFLDAAIGSGLLPAKLEELPALSELVAEYRRVEAEVPVPRRAPGVLPGTSFDQPLFTRGDHKKPDALVERRYLELFGGKPFRPQGSGRLELALALASPQNPLTARVMVNRLWSNLFSQGIVATVDNFGATGEKPSHPELLDYLAERFVETGWSIKDMISLMVRSRAYQMTSAGSEQARDVDPGNRLLERQNFRRLSAEEIRDAILATSGELDATMYGPSVNVYYVGKTEGGGEKGPLDGKGRRSVYQAIRRNSHNPFLEVFDAPKPSTTRGRRDVTNIPAQSLALLNDPFVIDQAKKWANRAVADGAIAPGDRAVRMFRRALSRDPAPEELDLLITSLGAFADERETSALMADERVWTDFAHALLNLKEFLYLR